MTEPDQIEFQERVKVSNAGPHARSIPVRIGIVAGSAILVVVGVTAAMGASPSSQPTGAQAAISAALAPDAGTSGVPPLDNRFGGGDFGFGGSFRNISIGAINGSSLSLKTDDGWTRTITIGSATTITRSGKTIAVGDLAVGDQINFSQEKATDGTFTIKAVRVILPVVGGQVSAVNGSTISVAGKGGTTGTIHVDGDTTYDVNGTTGKALADITVGSFIVAEGTKRSDGSLDADTIHSGFGGPRDGKGGGPGFPDRHGKPDAAPTPTPASTAS